MASEARVDQFLFAAKAVDQLVELCADLGLGSLNGKTLDSLKELLMKHASDAALKWYMARPRTTAIEPYRPTE